MEKQVRSILIKNCAIERRRGSFFSKFKRYESYRLARTGNWRIEDWKNGRF
jgi:hypothetical protein